MIIDAQSHGLHGKYFDKLADIGGEWARKVITSERERAKERPQYLDISLRVEQLAKFGFDYQAVTLGNHIEINCFPGEPATRLALARELNDNMARLMQDSKGKLLGIGTVPLENFEPEGRREMERAIQTLGLKGISLPSHINGKPLDAPQYESFWALAARLDTVVYIHPRNAAGSQDRPYEFEYDLAHSFGWPFETVLSLSRLVFSGIMERYPTLKIISHHLGGGMLPFFWGRILETYEVSRQPRLLGRTMPKPLFEYFKLFYYDTAVGGSKEAVKCAYDVFGASPLVFATDAPMGPEGGLMRLRTYPESVKALRLPAAETEQILSGNACRIFKI